MGGTISHTGFTCGGPVEAQERALPEDRAAALEVAEEAEARGACGMDSQSPEKLNRFVAFRTTIVER